MARRSFEQAVNRIRELDASEEMTAFEMGDVALEQCPIGADGAHNDSQALLHELAETSGVDYTVLYARRFVSSRVPPMTRVTGVTWTVYRDIANVGDPDKRERMLLMVFNDPPTMIVSGIERPTKHGRWTIDAVLSHLGEKPANPPPGSGALLKRAFREATPEMIVDALEEREIRSAVYEALHQREEKVAERTERLTQADPVSRGLAEQQAMLDLQGWVDHMRRQVERLRDDILPRLGKAPTRDPMALRRFLSEALADLDDAISPVRTFVDSGTTDIDRFLSEVLGGTKNG